MAKDIITGVLIELLLFAASVFVPIAGSFCNVFMPLPVLYYRVKLGRRPGLGVPAATTVVLAAIIGQPSLHLLGFVELLLAGYLLGELLEMRLTVEQTLGLACAGVTAAGAIGLLLTAAASGSGPVETLRAYIAENVRLTVEIYRAMGMPESNVLAIEKALDAVQGYILAVVPGLVVCTTLLIGWLNLLAARNLLARRGLMAAPFGALNRWRSPEQLVWAVIAAAVLALLPGRAATVVGVNVLLALLPVYLFQGMAIVAFFFEKKRIPRGMRAVLYGILMLQHVLLVVVIGMGFFDIWLNIRRIGRETA